MEVVPLPAAHAETPQAPFTHEPAAFEQARRPPDINPDVGGWCGSSAMSKGCQWVPIWVSDFVSMTGMALPMIAPQMAPIRANAATAETTTK